VATPVTNETAATPPPKVHRRRFAMFYASLAALLAVGAATGVHLATRTIVKPKPWASWAPIQVTPEGKVRDKATATGGYKFFDGPSVEYQLCGNTTKGNCTIDQKKITPNQSGALTRRMAYELALMTFHYVPEVKNVAVLLPAVVKGQKARMLVLERTDIKDPKSLSAGLRIVPIKELKDGKNAGLPNSNQATNIAKSTDAYIFHYEVTATSDNQPVYLITPLLISDTAGKASKLSG